MLTQIRADILSEILSADAGYARRLLAVNRNEALEQINILGHNFTLDEIFEFEFDKAV